MVDAEELVAPTAIQLVFVLPRAPIRGKLVAVVVGARPDHAMLL